ncbi:cupredoxin domain-containing protein [Azonexus sp.]|uniref:cupredoxin domain-containing protein n=1 Tax=Azonexus sp. TaxID=1872668 RepID=UPI00282FBF52|nr:cupredoxin domain-containing protein [Azonexus sp.]MDR1994738.1 cupredoxin domain-containing protein [Azonexus sp.]
MKTTLHSVALAMLLYAGAALADDMPTFLLVMKDGRLFPEIIEIPANTRFRLEVRNEGPGAAEFESRELRKELVLAPGVTRKLVFRPMKPGSYKFFDEFHPETAQGRIVAK